MEKDFKTIENFELQLVDADVRKDEKRLSELLADDFEELGKSGKIYSKQQIISMLLTEASLSVDLSNFRYVRLSAEVVLVKYKSFCDNVYANRSSIWVKYSGTWQMLYHQGTIC